MSYKFQRGSAILSGSITAEEGLVSTTVSGSGKFDVKELAIDSQDVTEVGTNLMTAADQAAGRTALGLGSMAVAGSGDYQPVDAELTELATMATATAAALADLSAAEVQSIDGVTAGTVSASKVLVADAQSDISGLRNLTITGTGSIGGDCTITGNLTVNGTTTTINSTTLSVDDRIIVIGDGLTALADAVTATAGFEIGTVASIKLNTNVNGSGLDGFECSLPFKATSFHGDGGALTGISADMASQAEGFRYHFYPVTASFNYNVESASGIHVPSGSNAANQYSASHAVNIHLSGSDGPWTNGNIVTIKAPSNASDFPVTIYGSGSGQADAETIDGDEFIVLESDNAAVTLLRAFDNKWVIV